MLKMDIIMKADPEGNLSVIVGTPTLFNPQAKDLEETLSPLQKAELKRGSDMILQMIEIWIREEGIMIEGGELQKFDPMVATANPIPVAEFFVNDIRHNPTNEWPDVKRKMIRAINGISFRRVEDEDIEKAVNP